MKPTRTWILIADGARARIVENLGHGKGIHAVPHSDLRVDHRPSRELGDDRPGRVVESHGTARHAVEPRSDPHQKLERLFAHQLADILADCHGKHEFDRLVVVAPPVMLGDLRQALGAEVRKAVVAEINKDLTKIPNDEVLRHIESEIAL